MIITTTQTEKPNNVVCDQEAATGQQQQGSGICETPRFKQLRTAIKNNKEGLDFIMIAAKPKRRLAKTERGSKYRGVSKNGKKWQVSRRHLK